MKKLILLLAFIPYFISCCTNGSTSSTNATLRGNTMISRIDTIVSINYADTLCMNESIPITTDLWISTPYVLSNGIKATKYMYIKKMDSLQTVYTIMIDSIKMKAHFIKRITFNKK